MPVTPTYPGVYIQEDPQSVHVIGAASTSVAAFVDVFERGPLNTPVIVCSWGEFVGNFGHISTHSKASYGIFQFFLNGGAMAWVVRVASSTAASSRISTAHVDLEAIGPGSWGNNLRARTQPKVTPGTPDGTFDLEIREITPQSESQPSESVAAVETYRQLSASPSDANYVETVLASSSNLVQMVAGSTPRPATPDDPTPAKPSTKFAEAEPVEDDWTLTPDDLGTEAADGPAPVAATGFYTLGDIAPGAFNILCLPAMTGFSRSQWQLVFSKAFEFCEAQRAFFIVDPPTVLFDDVSASDQVAAMQKWFVGPDTPSAKTNHAAIYFPRLSIDDPIGAPTPVETEASGTLAGIYASTDAARGVWKAPAGTEATLTGVVAPTVTLDDTTNGALNELGVNGLRTFPVFGTVSWGARTLDGADLLASEWKYISVRRLALFIEQSLDLGTQWAVFEPNDEPLWGSLRLSVSSFMDGLYKQGAFAGQTTKDSYFVRCDATTTTPTDQRNGVVNVLVGFAPQYPAEFVVITISQPTQPSPVGASAPAYSVQAEMQDLVRRVEPIAGWDDLELPHEQIALLRELVHTVRPRSARDQDGGFGARATRGAGTTALFSGPSGTAKALAAEVVAKDAGLELHVVDLSPILSKYIGETEKNIGRVFDAAERSGAVLLFDEADALFGKRTEVKDSHDRHTDVGVSYLMERVESHPGLAIFTTSRRANIDDAFIRRCRFLVEFPLSDQGAETDPSKTQTTGEPVNESERRPGPAGPKFGKYRGKVVETRDPLGLGRLLVEVPAAPESEAVWAMPCVPYADPQVGFSFIPPIGTKVWIEFEGGDTAYPIWVGRFWDEGEMPNGA